jgi:hypothetical protein
MNHWVEGFRQGARNLSIAIAAIGLLTLSPVVAATTADRALPPLNPRLVA